MTLVRQRTDSLMEVKKFNATVELKEMVNKIPKFEDDSESTPRRCDFESEEINRKKSSKRRSKSGHGRRRSRDVKRQSSSSKSRKRKYNTGLETEFTDDQPSGHEQHVQYCKAWDSSRDRTLDVDPLENFWRSHNNEVQVVRLFNDPLQETLDYGTYHGYVVSKGLKSRSRRW